jgi:protein-S-isoprenylcysteine O-methyltransferase Ste14
MSLYLKVAVLFVVTAGFLWISRRSLRDARLHGFYRFFAWEAIVILVLVNIDRWFDDPFCLRQIVSWALLSISVYLVVYGTVLLYRTGKPNRVRHDPSLVGIERTTELVKTGVYRYIRHPIYGALVVGVWGVVLKHPSWLALSLALVGVALLTVTAKMEEAENVRHFGNEYRDYMRQTKMFIPYLF